MLCTNLVLFLLLAGTVGCQMPIVCPQGCECTRWAAHCRGDNDIYVNAVSSLPPDTKNFTFSMFSPVLNKEVGLVLNEAPLDRLRHLQIFQIQPYSQDHRLLYNLVGIQDGIFCNSSFKTSLRELHLNAKIFSYVSEAEIRCLANLEVLDLSYVKRLSSSNIRALLAAPVSPHLKALLLRNIQTFTGLDQIWKLDFTQLSAGLKRSTLESIEVLDFSANGFTSLYPGLILMPNLKKLDLSENLLFAHPAEPPTILLTVMEAFLHPSMEEIIIADQRIFPSRRRREAAETITEVEASPLAFPEPAASAITIVTAGNSSTDTNFCYHGYQRPDLPWLRLLSRRQQQLLVAVVCNLSVESTTINTYNKTPPVTVDGQSSHPNHNSSSGCWLNIVFPLGKHIRTFNISALISKDAGPFPNPLPSTCSLCFVPNNRMEEMDLSDNRLSEFLSSPVLSDFTLVGLPKLKLLAFRNNDMILNSMDTFKELPSLESLLLGGNTVNIHLDHASKMFKDLHNLRVLDLSRSHIATVPHAEFATLSKLEVLDLSGNQMQKIDLQLPASASFRLLNISGNKLVSLDGSMTKRLDAYPNLEVDMQENVLTCGCQSFDFVEWVQTTRVKFTGVNNMYCSRDVERILVMKVPLHTLYKQCHPLTPLQTGLIACSATVCCFCLLLGTVYAYRRRWRIRYFWYRRRLRRQYAQLNDDYEYDAFIAYTDDSPDDKRWVQNELGPELEDKRGLKLSIDQRDLLAGVYHLEGIDLAMRKCRKMLLVLSPVFLRSRICLYEAWSAHTSMVMEDRDAVVLVKLEPLPIAGIAGQLTSLMEIRECLDWTQDPVGQELFWNRLEDAILSPPVNPIVE